MDELVFRPDLNPAEIMDPDPRFVQNTDLNRTKITEPATLLGLRSNTLFQVMILFLLSVIALDQNKCL